MNWRESWKLLLFLLFFLMISLLCGFAPKDRGVWLAEVIPSWIMVLAVVALWLRGIRFSVMAYIFLLIPLSMEAVGGHYSYAEVPCGWFNDLIGGTRNCYDRAAHVAVGCFAWPLLEWIEQKRWSNSPWFTAVMTVMLFFGVGAVYEILEWLYATRFESSSAEMVLGSQGDVWDAQKDMLCDGAGAALTVLLFYGTKAIRSCRIATSRESMP